MQIVGRKLNEICKGKNEFGLVVAKKLYILGKEQKWLAVECGVSEAYISRIIHGKARPSAKITEKIAQLLDMDVYKLRELVLKKLS